MNRTWKTVGAGLLFTLSFFGMFGVMTFGQGLLVNESSVAMQLPRHIIILPPHPPTPPRPEPVSSYAIKSLEVNADVKGQIAEVNVSQTFTNTGSRQMEVSFVFPLPYDGAIDSMTLLVDGKEYAAKLLDAPSARKTYEEIVRRNQDPALLEWIGTGMFKTSVFPVPAGASRTVSLKYTQLLRVDGGLTDFLFPMSTAKYTARPVEKVAIHLTVETPDEIKNIYSPTHEIKIKRPTPNRATVSFDAQNTIPSNDFRLLFDSGRGEVGTRLISFRPDPKDDGYFMLLTSPRFGAAPGSELPLRRDDPLPSVADEKEKRQPASRSDQSPVSKVVVFVVDESSSMSGDKIVQAREALKFVLNNLREGDRFNIVRYGSGVSKFKEELQPFTDPLRAEAIAYTESIRASGMTNIEAALKTSFAMITDRSMPTYILFLTDGCPTAGETNEMKLAELARSANQYGARLFAFGVGFDVNARLLDRMARDNRGQTEYVKPNENIEERVGRLFNRISSPILTDVAFEFHAKGSKTPSYGVNRVYPGGAFDLFAGEQLVVVGRYSKPGDVDIAVRGKIGDESKEYRFDGKFVEKSDDQTLTFIPRLWAMRRIGEILDQIDLHGKNEELVKELVELSTQYGILTPYTSFLADETTVLTDFSGNASVATSNVSNLAQTTGRAGVMQRSSKMMYQSAMQIDSSRVRDEALGAEMAMNAPAAVPPALSAQTSNAFMPGAGRARRSAGFGAGDGRGVVAGFSPASRPVDLNANVQTVNNRAFFRKGDVWIDSTLTEEQQKPENVVTVKQFSDDYFRLIEKHGKEIAPLLSLGGTQLVNVAGKAYRFEP